MRIVLTGGGTAGHVIPFEPLIESLRALFLEERGKLPSLLDPEELELSFLGVVDRHTQEMFATYDVPTTHILSGKLRRYVSGSGLTIIDLLFRLPLGVCIALYHMWKIMPDIVVSKGGFGSVPVVLAAAFYRIPTLLHESDARPGLANRKMIPFASAVAVGFESTRQYLGKWQYKMFVTGTPIRAQITKVPPDEARKALGIPKGERVLLVVGGSQGAKQLNEVLLKVLPALIEKMAIIHIAGEQHFPAVSAVAKELLTPSGRKDLYKPFDYLNSDKMASALAACDGVVSRAGSMLAEIAHLRKPALLIPLANSASDHQRTNAQAFESAGAALVLDPNNLGENIFRQNVETLMFNDDVRTSLQKNVEIMDIPDASKRIAQLAFQLAQGLAPEKPSLIKKHEVRSKK